MEVKKSRLKLGIVVYKFPVASNTFVVNEVMELLNNDIDLHIYSIGKPNEQELNLYKKQMERLDGKITYLIDQKIFTWHSLTSRHIPFLDNIFRKELNQFTCNEMIHNEEEIAISQSKNALAGLILEIRNDEINKLYAPFSGMDTTLCMMISKHLEIPFYFSCHAYDLFCQFYYSYFKVNDVTKIFSISEYNKKYLIDQYGADPNKIIIKRVNYVSNRITSTKNISYPYIFSAGRLTEMKGYEYSIKAFGEFHKNHPDVHYIIAGGGKNKYTDLIDELDLSEYVHIIQHIPNSDVIRYINGSLFCLLTSITTSENDTEGIPTFFIEAMSKGKPCIGTNYSGIPELIDHGSNGFLVEEKNINKIVEAMDTLYNIMCGESGKDFSKNAKSKIKDVFNNKENTMKMIEILI